MSSINATLSKHKIILGLDDRGKLSCHKVNLCFIYFDNKECVVSARSLEQKMALGGNSCPYAIVAAPRLQSI